MTLVILAFFLIDLESQHNQGNNAKLKPKKAKPQEFVPPSKPDYNELETKFNSSQIHLDPVFIKACEAQAGYYKDPLHNPSLSKTLIMAGVNNGYKDFLHNFKCYMDRLGLKFLPISLDEGIYNYIKR